MILLVGLGKYTHKVFMLKTFHFQSCRVAVAFEDLGNYTFDCVLEIKNIHMWQFYFRKLYLKYFKDVMPVFSAIYEMKLRASKFKVLAF